MCAVLPSRADQAPAEPALDDDVLAIARVEVERALSRWLPAPPACPAGLAEVIRYAVGTRGKRVRPLLALASADAVAWALGGDARARALARAHTLPAACAVELVHAQSLVHDDLPAMDDAALRRGQPAVHVRYGEGLAILAGDALLAEAFHLPAREAVANADPIVRARALRVLAELGAAIGCGGMAGGQAMDLAYTGSCRPGAAPAVDVSVLAELHRRKTGALIRAAAVAGAVMAGGDDRHAAALARFAEGVGLAYQIVDDVLDVVAGEDTLGKASGLDAGAGKLTYPALVGLDAARHLAHRTVGDAQADLAAEGLLTPCLRGMAGAVVAPIA